MRSRRRFSWLEHPAATTSKLLVILLLKILPVLGSHVCFLASNTLISSTLVLFGLPFLNQLVLGLESETAAAAAAASTT